MKIVVTEATKSSPFKIGDVFEVSHLGDGVKTKEGHTLEFHDKVWDNGWRLHHVNGDNFASVEAA